MENYHINLVITLSVVSVCVGSFLYIFVYPRKNDNAEADANNARFRTTDGE